MAVLKHLSSKSSDYGKALEYLMFQHNERTQEPILNEKGVKMLRDEYYLDGINCDPFSFDKECLQLNAYYHKNQKYNEIKTHHYILSFDPRDKDESGLTGQRAQALGLEFANRFFVGHQALVCTHMDGHNGSGNIHVHIVINSLRKLDVDRQDFMERLCDSKAGYKHNQTRALLRTMQQGIMEIADREHLHQVDLLSPAPVKITNREYWKNRREQEKLDKQNASILADEKVPKQSKYQTQKQYLRDAISEISAYAKSLDEFKTALFENYGISAKESRGRFSYLHPDRETYITARKLGSDYERSHLLEVLSENEKGRSMHNAPEPLGKTSYAPNYDYASNPLAILYIRSNLRLVVDLQTNIKAQQSAAYAQKVKITNLKEMAKTVCYIQEHSFDTRDDLNQAYETAAAKLSEARRTLRSTEDWLKEINEQVRFVGKYYANKSVKSEFLKAKNKAAFRQEHQAELEAYEAGVKYIKEHFAGKVPSLKALKSEKSQLLQMKTAQAETYRYFSALQKELQTVCSNVDSILGKERARTQSKDKSRDI